MHIDIRIPGVVLGVLEAESARVAPAGVELAAEMDSVCEQVRRHYTVEQVAETPALRSVRAMFRGWGVDPARYRPSSEALLRRVVQGKGLYRINNVVDVNNLGSIETGWPYGTYDRARLTPPVTLRLGEAGETYEGIGKHTWHLAGRPVLADSEGPFGSPISDSVRSMITDAATTVLTVIFAPGGTSPAALEQALARLAQRLGQHAGATPRATVVLAP